MNDKRWCSAFRIESMILFCIVMLSGLQSYSLQDYSLQGYNTEYIVKIKSGQLSSAAFNLRTQYNLRTTGSHPQGNLLKISVPRNAQAEASLKSLAQRNDVEYIVENITLHSFTLSNDPESTKQWALEKINAAGAWKMSVGSQKVVVAVIDTGMDYNHEDLQANLWVNPKETKNGKDDDNNGLIDDVNGWDFLQNDNDPMDATGAMNPGHGTHCSGIVGAVGNNEKGISGMSQVVSLMPLRFLGENGQGDLMNAIKAVDYAVENGAHVISASFGATVPEAGAKPLIEAIDRAAAKGVIMVAAAANDGKNNDNVSVFPANAKNLISVAASDSSDKKPSWSNFGQAKVHVAAPGHEIYSTLPKNLYKNLSGTSMATPLVAGLVALMKSVNPDLTLDQARALLQTTGVAVDIKTACDCRVDAAAAVDAALNKKLTTMPAAATLKIGDELQFSAFGGKAPYTFSSSDAAIASIAADGKLKAVAKGSVVITVIDNDKNKTVSKNIWINDGTAKEPGAGQCPFDNPLMCSISCIIMPSMPWCDGSGGGGDDGDNELPFPMP